jgi:uncharacterized protein YukE
MTKSLEFQPGREVPPSEGAEQAFEVGDADARKELQQVGFSSEYGNFRNGDSVKILRNGKVEDGWEFHGVRKEMGKDGVVRERIVVTKVEDEKTTAEEEVSPSDFERVQELSPDWVKFDVEKEKKDGGLHQLEALRAEILNPAQGEQGGENIPHKNHNVMGVSEAVIASNRARAEKSARSNAEERPVKIDEAQSFEELYSTIDQMGGLPGSSRHYSAEELKGIIDRVRAGELGLDTVTSTDGLRKTVARLTRAQANENIPRQKDNVREISKDDVENSRIGTIESTQSVEQMKALVEGKGYLFEGADANRIAVSIGELQELAKNTKVNGKEWSQTWDKTFDQYPQSKEMTALKGKLAELFTGEYKKSHSARSRINRFLGRAA